MKCATSSERGRASRPSIFAAPRAERPVVARLRRRLLAGADDAALEREFGRRSRAPLLSSRLVERRDSPDGATKLAVRMADGAIVETVVLRTPRGVSVCLSTQVGCPIACVFCASGRDGLLRSLLAHEIVEQVVWARRTDPRVDRLVVMGIGEPLLNASALFAALDVVRDEGGIGARRMVVSTVGVRGGIDRLLAWGRRVNLALSLHAPDDEIRRRLVPTQGGRTVEGLVAEAERFARATRNKAIVEYVLVRGVNDGEEHARALGRLLRGRPLYANLIDMNAVEGCSLSGPGRQRARRFAEIVRRSGAFATVRDTLGAPEVAACGQLRARLADPSASSPPGRRAAAGPSV